MDYPFALFGLTFFGLWLSAVMGSYLRRRANLERARQDDLSVILGATLTLLGIVIGFSFSMAITRYDQRKNYEEAESNAIGTEYFRTDLLPAVDAARTRSLLRKYLDRRIQFYTTRDVGRLNQINASTMQLQNELWSVVQAPAMRQPTAVISLAVSGMNDVLNSQSYTQAAWWNHIPGAAWVLMIAIAIFCNLLFGYSARRPESEKALFLALPLVVSVSFFLIADMDSPRGGVILVSPRNLVSLSESLSAK